MGGGEISGEEWWGRGRANFYSYYLVWVLLRWGTWLETQLAWECELYDDHMAVIVQRSGVIHLWDVVSRYNMTELLCNIKFDIDHMAMIALGSKRNVGVQRIRALMIAQHYEWRW